VFQNSYVKFTCGDYFKIVTENKLASFYSRYEMEGTLLEANFKDERLLRLERQSSMENLGDSREIEFKRSNLFSHFLMLGARLVSLIKYLK
jgi:hypothetical protein